VRRVRVCVECADGRRRRVRLLVGERGFVRGGEGDGEPGARDPTQRAGRTRGHQGRPQYRSRPQRPRVELGAPTKRTLHRNERSLAGEHQRAAVHVRERRAQLSQWHQYAAQLYAYTQAHGCLARSNDVDYALLRHRRHSQVARAAEAHVRRVAGGNARDARPIGAVPHDAQS